MSFDRWLEYLGGWNNPRKIAIQAFERTNVDSYYFDLLYRFQCLYRFKKSEKNVSFKIYGPFLEACF